MQQIYIDDIGKGFPLVLIHGYLGSSEMWFLQKKFLVKNYRIIAPALPGFGESYKVKSLDSINKMTKLLLKLINEKNINKFHLLGHSMGGMIVQEMAKISGEKIKKLICFATGSIGDIPGRFESIDTSIEKLKKEGIKETVKRITPKWFVKGKKDENYYLCENAVKQINEEAAYNALIAMKNWNGYENLGNIENKTLIVWGDKDLSYNFEQVNILNKNIPNSKLEIFKECSHNLHLEQPKKFNYTVQNFLNE